MSRRKKAHKFTPGEWIAVGAWVEHPDAAKADICSCNPDSIDQGYLDRSWEEMEANARLIAAAPSMLRALEGLLTDPNIVLCSDARVDRAAGAVFEAIGVQYDPLHRLG